MEDDDAKSLIESFDALGGFPMLDKDKWSKTYENAYETDDRKVEAVFTFVVELFKYGHEYKSIVTLDSIPDIRNTSRTIIEISQGQMYDADLKHK